MRFSDGVDQFDMEKGANLTDLSDLFDVSPYLSKHSDLIALMVMEHQTMVQNRITVANYYGRIVEEQAKLAKRSGKSEDGMAKYRLKNAVKRLSDSLLLAYEAELTGPIRGTSKFAQEFVARGPVDPQGRSLRELDLKDRLFRYPCSYLIYSEAFDGLPKSVRKLVYEQIRQVLSAEEPSRRYRHLTPEMQRTIVEILRTTKPELQRLWADDAVSRDAKRASNSRK